MTAQPYNRFALCRGRGICREMEIALGALISLLKQHIS